jgi:monofunctional biosynthetic peptidoglycan transglycosylase
MLLSSVKKPFIVALKIAAAVLVSYAVLFTIAATITLMYLVTLIGTPITQVKQLAHRNPKISSFMAEYRKHAVASGDTATLRWRFVPLDSISKNLINAVIASEDDAFYIHPGIDIAAIMSAYERNRSEGRIAHGGSTITQQVAKNLFLSKERTFTRKYKEIMYTFLLEAFLEKDRILELYLNYAQWGKSIFGCEAASRYYYHKSSYNLSMWEATRMAAILAKPEKLNPQSTSNGFIAKRLLAMADNLYLHREITESTYIALIGQPPPPRAGDSAGKDTFPPINGLGSGNRDPANPSKNRF